MSPLQSKALVVAGSMLGVREQPPGSNRGGEVDEFNRSVGLNPEGHYPWCASFTFYCFQKAAESIPDCKNLCPRTGSALGLWHLAEKYRSKAPSAGSVFVMDFGHGTGHVGFVESVNDSTDGAVLHTIEGNTNDGGSREGIGVFRRTRKASAINMGYLNFV